MVNPWGQAFPAHCLSMHQHFLPIDTHFLPIVLLMHRYTDTVIEKEGNIESHNEENTKCPYGTQQPKKILSVFMKHISRKV